MRSPVCDGGRGASDTHLTATRPVVTSTARPSASRSRDRGGSAGESGRTDSQRLPNGIITGATNLPHGPKIRNKGTWHEAKFLILAFPISDTERRGEPQSFQTSKKLPYGAYSDEKGNSGFIRNPLYFQDGAEGGTQTPTGFPTTPSRSRCLCRVCVLLSLPVTNRHFCPLGEGLTS